MIFDSKFLSLFLLFFQGFSFAYSIEEFGYTWKHCEREDLGGMTIPFDKDGEFLPECAPDTLYHWGDFKTIKIFRPKPGDTNVLNMRPNLYTWRTPIGANGFGDTLFRIKLKPGVKFVSVNFDRGEKRECGDEPNTIHVAWIKDILSEYILCSSDVVESWSVGQPETNQEMKREWAWVLSHEITEFDRFNTKLTTKKDILYALGGDGLETIKIPQKAEPEIYFATGVAPDRLKHFSTRTPGYFNPNVSADKP